MKLYVGLLVFIISIFSIHSDDKVLYPFSIKSTSYLIEDSRHIYHPYKLYDNNVSTSYSESLDGDGNGCKLFFYFQETVEINQIHFVNGFQENLDYYLLNNRAKSIMLEVYDDDIKVYNRKLKLTDTKEKQVIEIKDDSASEIKGNKIVLTLNEVYKGSKYDDTCLSEITFLGNAVSKKLLTSENLEKFDLDSVYRNYNLIKNNRYIVNGIPLYSVQCLFNSNFVDMVFSFSGAPPTRYTLSYSVSEKSIDFYPVAVYSDFMSESKQAREQFSFDPHFMIRAKILNLDDDSVGLEFTRVDSIIEREFDRLAFYNEMDQHPDKVKQYKDRILLLKLENKKY